MKTVNGGYFKKLLRINLSNGNIKSEAIPDSLLHDFIGGRGLGSKLLFDEIPAGTDALSEENILMFLTGPLTGINAPATNRFTVVSKSPLTGTVGGCS
ncbi:MAG: aldehyde ferredoxin oxidoreductase, partial [Bacteroidetes bacterium]|nr:aldehyde ferredoxin oxidoreductase [Bacteroidota bacterium]